MYGRADLNAGFLRTVASVLTWDREKLKTLERCVELVAATGDVSISQGHQDWPSGIQMSREGKRSMARTHCGSPTHILWGQNSTVGLFSASEPVTLGQDRPRAEANLHLVPKPPVLGPNSILAGFCVAAPGSAQGALVLAALLDLFLALNGHLRGA